MSWGGKLSVLIDASPDKAKINIGVAFQHQNAAVPTRFVFRNLRLLGHR